MDGTSTYATPDPGSDNEEPEYRGLNVRAWVHKTNIEQSRSVRGLQRQQELHHERNVNNRHNEMRKKNEKVQLIPMAQKESGGNIKEEPKVSIEAKHEEVNIKMTVPDEEILDMADRDPTRMNTHVRVGFEEVFAEPEGMHSFSTVWRFSYVTFVSSRFWCYRLITFICAIPASVLWGFYFALLTFTHIWCVVPCIKATFIKLQCVGQSFGILVRTFLDPVCIAFAKVFSNIHITTTKE